MPTINPPPLIIPKLLANDPEARAAYSALLTVIRQLWVKAGASIILEDGTELVPSLAFVSEAGLGFYKPAARTIGVVSDSNDVVWFSDNGLKIFNIPLASALFNDAAGNIDGVALTDGQLLIGDTGGIPVANEIDGTAGKITVTNGPGTITITIAADYVGQSSITTLGTVTAGGWNADPIDLGSYVTGDLGVSHLDGGVGASAATFWRGDGTWAAASGGGIYGTASIDFGAYPGGNEASVAVTGVGGILSTSKVMAFIMGDDTSVDHTASDHRYGAMLMDLTCGTPTNGVGFTIYARSAEKLQGVWTVRYLWAN